MGAIRLYLPAVGIYFAVPPYSQKEKSGCGARLRDNIDLLQQIPKIFAFYYIGAETTHLRLQACLVDTGNDNAGCAVTKLSEVSIGEFVCRLRTSAFAPTNYRLTIGYNSFHCRLHNSISLSLSLLQNDKTNIGKPIINYLTGTRTFIFIAEFFAFSFFQSGSASCVGGVFCFGQASKQQPARIAWQPAPDNYDLWATKARAQRLNKSARDWGPKKIQKNPWMQIIKISNSVRQRDRQTESVGEFNTWPNRLRKERSTEFSVFFWLFFVVSCSILCCWATDKPISSIPGNFITPDTGHSAAICGGDVCRAELEIVCHTFAIQFQFQFLLIFQLLLQRTARPKISIPLSRSNRSRA